MLPKNILVATDFSEQAHQAVLHAIELAKKIGASVHLLHVYSIPVVGLPEGGVMPTGKMLDQIIGDSRGALEKVAAECAPSGVLGQHILRAGDAREVIVSTAKELAVDLVVVGTHGRRGLSRVILGSVAESVVRTAPCPVLTVRPAHS
jgi:nucleotide-binding universal stress UspA family protein